MAARAAFHVYFILNKAGFSVFCCQCYYDCVICVCYIVHAKAFQFKIIQVKAVLSKTDWNAEAGFCSHASV